MAATGCDPIRNPCSSRAVVEMDSLRTFSRPGVQCPKKNQRRWCRAGPNRPGCFIAGTLHDFTRKSRTRISSEGGHAFRKVAAKGRKYWVAQPRPFGNYLRPLPITANFGLLFSLQASRTVYPIQLPISTSYLPEYCAEPTPSPAGRPPSVEAPAPGDRGGNIQIEHRPRTKV